uniref:FTH domain-containing protein n=1 Tax=Panagrellus redivivus TaxID=6233 RepID=A0A7E4VFX0_PANRE
MLLQLVLLECNDEISPEQRMEKIVTYAAINDQTMEEVTIFLKETDKCDVHHPSSIEFEVGNIGFKWNSEDFNLLLVNTIIENCKVMNFTQTDDSELEPWFRGALAARKNLVQLNIMNVMECTVLLFQTLVQFPKINKITFRGINQEMADILTLYSRANNVTIYDFCEEDPLPIVKSIDLQTVSPNCSFKHAVDTLSPITEFLQVNSQATDFTTAIRQFESLFKVKHVKSLTVCIGFEPSIAGTNLRVFTKKLVICIKMYVAVIKRLMATTKIPTVSVGVLLTTNVNPINDDYIEQLLILENIEYKRHPACGFTMFDLKVNENQTAVFGVKMAHIQGVPLANQE